MKRNISKKKIKQLKKQKAQEEAYKEKYKRADIWFWIGIGALFFLFFMWGSQNLGITDPVESNYALTAKEMITSGDWISPTIYGQYWYDKPIMTYWLIAISYLLMGANDFASRFPSAIAGALSVVLIMWYVKRITLHRKIALWAGIMAGTSIEVWTLSHAIITDNFLFLFTIPTMLSAYIGIQEHNVKHMMIAYGAAALACLTKGPVGLVLPGALLFIWCLTDNPKVSLRRLFPWQGILVFLVLALPWYGAMISIHGNDFIDQFLGLHNVLRATSSEHPQMDHWYYYLIVLPLSLLPWTGLTIYEIKKGWKNRSTLYKFLMIWLVGVFLFYTIIATKYVTYTYIAVIPGIILASLSYDEITRGETAPSLCAVIPFFILLAAAIGASLHFFTSRWIVLYVIALYPIWSFLFRWKATAGRRLIIISAVTASCYLCLIAFGLPSFLATRTTEDSAPYLSQLEGSHYFFRSYPASYTFYSGDIGIKLDPELSLTEKRNSAWNEKYMMPQEDENTFVEKANASDTPTYIYVENVDQKYFDQWDLKDHVTPKKKTMGGTIYQWNQPEKESQEVSDAQTDSNENSNMTETE